jgi:transposase
MEDFVTIRNLKHKNEGKLSNREIAGLLHISHNTVKKALENTQYHEYKRESVINPDIKPFKDYIEERLLNAKLKCSRVLSEIKSKGYKGSKSAFYRYSSKLKPTITKTFKPYETDPGEQSQFDWSPYTITIYGILTKVYVYSYILGFSRYRIYEASLSQTLGSVLDALETSILETGGVTSRIQTDNAGCFILDATKNNFRWNPRYQQFCGHYCMEPTRSLPAHPWSKGKVEKPFSYLEDHFIKGNEFSSFEDFCSRLKTFQTEVNNRVHLTTKQTPKVLFEKELSSLGSLPVSRYVDIKEQVRKVTADCLISFNGSRYSVPYHFACKEVWLKITRGSRLQIYSSKNILIAEHVLSLEKGKIIMKDEHYEKHRIERGNFNRLSRKFTEMFPEHEWFLDKLKTQKKINPNYHLTRIVEISNFYRKDDMEKAFTACNDYNSFSYNIIKGHLENHCQIEQIAPIPIDEKILSSIKSVNIVRPLSDYKLNNYQQL